MYSFSPSTGVIVSPCWKRGCFLCILAACFSTSFLLRRGKMSPLATTVLVCNQAGSACLSLGQGELLQGGKVRTYQAKSEVVLYVTRTTHSWSQPVHWGHGTKKRRRKNPTSRYHHEVWRGAGVQHWQGDAVMSWTGKCPHCYFHELLCLDRPIRVNIRSVWDRMSSHWNALIRAFPQVNNVSLNLPL